MFHNVGDKVGFFNLHDEFEYVNDIERFIDDSTFYEVLEIFDEIIIVKSLSLGRDIPIDINEYQIHTKESLRDTIKSKNYKYADICKKIKQLYRKHNNSDSSFKFQGV